MYGIDQVRVRQELEIEYRKIEKSVADEIAAEEANYEASQWYVLSNLTYRCSFSSHSAPAKPTRQTRTTSNSNNNNYNSNNNNRYVVILPFSSIVPPFLIL